MERDASRRARVVETVRALESEGIDAVWVDRAPVFDKATLMHALYQALELPAWFGFNWDALHDVLSDIGGDRSLVLVFEDLELLEERDPAAARMLLDIVATIAANPAARLRGIERAGKRAP